MMDMGLRGTRIQDLELSFDDLQERREQAEILRQGTLHRMKEFQYPDAAISLARGKDISWWMEQHDYRRTADILRDEAEQTVSEVPAVPPVPVFPTREDTGVETPLSETPPPFELVPERNDERFDRERAAAEEKERNERNITHIREFDAIDIQSEFEKKRAEIEERAKEVERSSRRVGVRGIPTRKEKISDRSKELYTIEWGQLCRELGREIENPIAVRQHLLKTVACKSRSSYSLERATLVRMSSPEVQRAVMQLPTYTELCRMMDRKPTPRVSDVTKARRRTKSQDTWERLLSHLPHSDAMAISAIRTLGCRTGELAGVILSRDGENIVADVPTLKHEPGARRKLTFTPAEPEFDFLDTFTPEDGSTSSPWSDYDADRIRLMWRQTLHEENLDCTPAWHLHALRHDAATRWKRARSEEMRDRMTTLSMTREEELEFYAPIMERLGHRDLRSTYLYGTCRPAAV